MTRTQPLPLPIRLRRFACAVALVTAAAAAAPAAARQPMGMDGMPDFYQRILTLPGAELHKAPGGGGAAPAKPPVFSIYYVFDRKVAGGDTWLEVGKAVDGRDTTWVKALATQDWEMMLVMQYAPPGQRMPVLFFDRQGTLSSLVQSPRIKTEVESLLQRVDGGAPDTGGVIAREPPDAKGAVDFKKRPYLLPILNFRKDEFDNGRPATLVEVAGVRAATPVAKEPAPAPPGPPDISKMKFGIMLVFDTTSSMQRYIDRSRAVVRRLYAKLDAKGLSRQVQFGVVGYRNNMDDRPQLEYVARVFQPLDPNASPAQVLARLDEVSASPVPTHSWSEDAVYGLHTALTRTDWKPFDVRILLQITDAGMLSANDPKAQLRGVGIVNLLDIARREKVAVFPVHLRTPQAERAGDIPRAARQYTELGGSGDVNANKYIPIDSGSEEVFAAQLEQTVGRLADAIEGIARGAALEKPKLDEPGKKPAMEALLLNEIFGAQQLFIGSAQRTDSPAFKASWASDRDLGNPARQSLTVSVFLTRNQLSTLGQSLQRILDAAKEAQLSPQKFFARLQALAAQTATNPEQGKFEDIADSGLMPKYLSMLPYRSRVLQLTEAKWLDMGFSGQQEFISDLESRLLAYRELNASDAWVDFGAGDPGLQVYPMALDLLP